MLILVPFPQPRPISIVLIVLFPLLLTVMRREARVRAFEVYVLEYAIS